MNRNKHWHAWLLALAVAAAVRIENFQFEPARLEVHAGDTVTWTNGDEELHAIVADDASFNSPGIDEKETYSRTFDKPGTYAYRCALHPHMTGTIVVK